MALRSGITCTDCGPYCLATKLARPMRGECKGFSTSSFYDSQEGGSNRLWAEESLTVRYCVQSQAFANLRAQSSQARLSQLNPQFQQFTESDAQSQCRQVWIDIRDPPTFFYTCNDPTGK
ncbi:hypothetical protein GUITHDRAFT_113252 [Guillardia theta CCMP2712]|uniref:Uncharacterized protein n=1 Tax=Guillardia theta (strain CCMP2712) TaxID=905079 RepID=L1IX90_GUITC|nr:hypothetical protein GUITHDRAFT_113252 [Guillardia theta CCMP2712]EKX40722.1 hypothetical protein GUITHDRAFT_113252 [Guillardia theta CCMP2712]|eukprot:XP_005827702.1 hypothetical protein GUITHDRAFT_113252 [Guillardia theta CCMP2712]